MSRGSGDYEVENRYRLERERQAALAGVRALEARIEDVTLASRARVGRGRREQRERPVIETAPSDGASTTELTAWAVKAEALVNRMSHEIAEADSADRAADLARHLLTIASSGELASQFRPEPRTEANGASTDARLAGPSLEVVTEMIEQVVARIDTDATGAERQRVDVAARQVLTGSGVDPATMLTELKVVVQQISFAAARRRADRERATVLLRRLDGSVGAEVDDLRTLLERVVSGQTALVDVDEARVASIRARAIAEEDRRYVAEHLASAFAELGYEVDAAFASDLGAGEPAHALVAGSPDHAVEFRLGAGRYSFRLVHTSPTADPRRDAEHELSLCKAVGRVTADAHDRGMNFTMDDYRAAGAESVVYVARAGERRQQQSSRVDRVRVRKP